MCSKADNALSHSRENRIRESIINTITNVLGKEDEAKRILRELGRSKDIDTELKAMMEINKEDSADRKWSQLFCIKSNRNSLLITVTLLSLNQAGGIMSVLYFSTMIFKNAASSVDPDVATIILGGTQCAGSIVTPFFINRCGRRILLLVSSSCCSLFLVSVFRFISFFIYCNTLFLLNIYFILHNSKSR